MKGTGPVAGSRALECAVVAIAAMLAADAFRANLAPLWQALRLLLGL